MSDTNDKGAAAVQARLPSHSACGHEGSRTVFDRLCREVVEAGLCTHCGTCVGLSAGSLEMQTTARGPIPAARGEHVCLPELAWEACPGKGANYPALYDYVFGQRPDNWLVGCFRSIHVGYSRVPEIRQNAASGGIITQTLIYLIDQGLVHGAIVVQQGHPKPWQATPIIARSAAEVIAASQSVYIPVPVNVILPEMERFDGKLAYVGLPDQVAALRRLQQLGHPGAQKVAYVLGPYVGTIMYWEALESYLRSNGIQTREEIAELRYREGEWPGNLYVRTHSGTILRLKKFYYNYLIPFYITRSTLYSADFTNELTDISVGDAWHPRYETQRGGFSVVMIRSQQGEVILRDMQQQGLVALQEITLGEALTMHAHMLDFKKRGAFVRIAWRKAMRKPIPDYGYRPKTIPTSRKAIELVISLTFAVCSTRLARRLVEMIPLSVLGPAFDTLRKTWKRISKPTKRKGLQALEFEVYDSPNR